jgi:transposase-like protein
LQRYRCMSCLRTFNALTGYSARQAPPQREMVELSQGDQRLADYQESCRRSWAQP